MNEMNSGGAKDPTCDSVRESETSSGFSENHDLPSTQNTGIEPGRKKKNRSRSHEPPSLSSRLSAPENIESQMHARDTIARDVLNSGPPLRVQQDLVYKPVRNGLLTDSGSVHVRSNPRSESRLATRNRDGTFERSNVIFLHERKEYTSKLVNVNENTCMTFDKGACTVYDMASRAKKRDPDAPEKAVKGPDGKTFGQRLEEAMDDRAGKLKQSRYTQAELVRDCNLIVSGNPDLEPPFISQQNISLILNGDASQSGATPVLAAALDVSPLWLQHGIGNKESDAHFVGQIASLVKLREEKAKLGVIDRPTESERPSDKRGRPR